MKKTKFINHHLKILEEKLFEEYMSGETTWYQIIQNYNRRVFLVECSDFVVLLDTLKPRRSGALTLLRKSRHRLLEKIDRNE